MPHTPISRTANFLFRCSPVALCATACLILSSSANAHQIWIETSPTTESGKPHKIEVCWGHSGSRTTGESLASQQAKLGVCFLSPSGARADLAPSLTDDCFTAKTTPEVPGYYTFGAELQVGIMPREFHGIPANTRIVMYGKSLTQVPGKEDGLDNSAGFDLELVPLTPRSELHRGGVVCTKLLFHGKPLGGKGVEVSLATPGKLPLPEHRRIQSHEWSIDAMPDPYTGEMAFPLIASGQHTFLVRYTDETPGTYDGPRNDVSDFSHLCKGDKYDRTMYMSTLTVSVSED